MRVQTCLRSGGAARSEDLVQLRERAHTTREPTARWLGGWYHVGVVDEGEGHVLLERICLLLLCGAVRPHMRRRLDRRRSCGRGPLLHASPPFAGLLLVPAIIVVLAIGRVVDLRRLLVASSGVGNGAGPSLLGRAPAEGRRVRGGGVC